ncbi:helix-turn-helix domain-containing GNAT family N-acetyltransferase [Apibacter raozihei]|uniref:bifunctional helix-turn-helix transcriptional regulator/GNAT family N-acetyltransferase n=1 Tax=Apibacter TaxID=1778601 RepID=UPI000FE2DC88|nr:MULTISPECIES: helix-turn-helix domain-containing GNAT family N-acetyltransferase [Apibacter]
MNLFEKTGKMALSSRLRLLTSQITEDASRVYQLYDIGFSPKWFPIFFILVEEGEKTITEIAQEVGHSQPSVTKIVKEMAIAGLVEDNRNSADKRKNMVALTELGKETSEKIKPLYEDVGAAVESLINEANHNLWEAMEEWEFLLKQKTLLRRVQEFKKKRESLKVQVVSYEPKYQRAFKELNEEWISQYFKMEANDYKSLDHPEEYIINKGGKILVALYEGKPLGVCALIKMDDPEYDYEMAKMAVSPSAQGKNLGWLLGQEIIRTAIELGASHLFLESNTLLKPAINLYYKMGFQKIVGRPSPYERANIQMVLDLKNFTSK